MGDLHFSDPSSPGPPGLGFFALPFSHNVQVLSAPMTLQVGNASWPVVAATPDHTQLPHGLGLLSCPHLDPA